MHSPSSSVKVSSAMSAALLHYGNQEKKRSARVSSRVEVASSEMEEARSSTTKSCPTSVVFDNDSKDSSVCDSSEPKRVQFSTRPDEVFFASSTKNSSTPSQPPKKPMPRRSSWFFDESSRESAQVDPSAPHSVSSNMHCSVDDDSVFISTGPNISKETKDNSPLTLVLGRRRNSLSTESIVISSSNSSMEGKSSCKTARHVLKESKGKDLDGTGKLSKSNYLRKSNESISDSITEATSYSSSSLSSSENPGSSGTIKSHSQSGFRRSSSIGKYNTADSDEVPSRTVENCQYLKIQPKCTTSSNYQSKLLSSETMNTEKKLATPEAAADQGPPAPISSVCKQPKTEQAAKSASRPSTPVKSTMLHLGVHHEKEVTSRRSSFHAAATRELALKGFQGRRRASLDSSNPVKIRLHRRSSQSPTETRPASGQNEDTKTNHLMSSLGSHSENEKRAQPVSTSTSSGAPSTQPSLQNGQTKQIQRKQKIKDHPVPSNSQSDDMPKNFSDPPVCERTYATRRESSAAQNGEEDVQHNKSDSRLDREVASTKTHVPPPPPSTTRRQKSRSRATENKGRPLSSSLNSVPSGKRSKSRTPNRRRSVTPSRRPETRRTSDSTSEARRSRESRSAPRSRSRSRAIDDNPLSLSSNSVKHSQRITSQRRRSVTPCKKFDSRDCSNAIEDRNGAYSSQNGESARTKKHDPTPTSRNQTRRFSPPAEDSHSQPLASASTFNQTGRGFKVPPPPPPKRKDSDRVNDNSNIAVHKSSSCQDLRTLPELHGSNCKTFTPTATREHASSGVLNRSEKRSISQGRANMIGTDDVLARLRRISSSNGFREYERSIETSEFEHQLKEAVYQIFHEMKTNGMPGSSSNLNTKHPSAENTHTFSKTETEISHTNPEISKSHSRSRVRSKSSQRSRSSSKCRDAKRERPVKTSENWGNPQMRRNDARSEFDPRGSIRSSTQRSTHPYCVGNRALFGWYNPISSRMASTSKARS